jgi:hypothetical protein
MAGDGGRECWGGAVVTRAWPYDSQILILEGQLRDS